MNTHTDPASPVVSAYERFFHTPLVGSWPFWIVTLLYGGVQSLCVWIVVSQGNVLGARSWFSVPMAVLAPFAWVRLIQLHRVFRRRLPADLDGPGPGGLTVAGAVAANVLSSATMTYLLLFLALLLIRRGILAGTL